jgi:hypothetical protein
MISVISPLTTFSPVPNAAISFGNKSKIVQKFDDLRFYINTPTNNNRWITKTRVTIKHTIKHIKEFIDKFINGGGRGGSSGGGGGGGRRKLALVPVPVRVDGGRRVSFNGKNNLEGHQNIYLKKIDVKG